MAVKKKTVAKKTAAKTTKKKTVKAEAKKTVLKTKPKTVSPPPSGGKKPKPTVRVKRILGIKERLSRQRKALLSEAEVAMNSLPDQTIFPDLGDQASVETDRNFMLKLRGREQRLLKKIDEAIDRIESGVFGICDVCGEEIQIERLEARPVTTMCINCKTEQEEEEKMMGG